MTERASALVTILFTDLVNSTELLARAGDEEAQRVFRAHHDLLTKAAAAHGGQEVKWLGDGLMVAFPSAVDAVRCAVAMQDESRRPIQGERLAIRVGLNAGETIRDEADYFGLPVVIARRLCDRADAGQILCTEVIAGLLVGRAGFAFSDLGKLELKGVPDSVGASEVRYEVAPPTGIPSRTHLVGREAELSRLTARLRETAAGSGGLVVVAGEPGIGKTRLTEELAQRVGRSVLVLWGRCLDGEWAPPYAPFAEALDAQVTATGPDQLRADLGAGAAPLAQLIPNIRRVLPDVGEPAPVQPDEERFRLLDAAAQFLAARSRRSPVLLCLDDLHWADRGTVAMLRHVARFASRSRLLILGTCRTGEVGPDHPLTDALAALRREVEYERVDLRGLDADAVEELVASFAEHEVSKAFVSALTEETEGNPFFIRELVAHLVEVGTIYLGPDGRWTTGRPIRELGVPEGVREVIARRVSRLSEGARRFLSVAAAFEGLFLFDVVRAVADLREDEALDAVDEAVAAQVIQPGGTADTYTFAHSLIRTTLYGELSPSRQVRLHRRVAEALEVAYGLNPSPIQTGEIAAQYQRSAVLPGAERGVEFAVPAAAHAEATGSSCSSSGPGSTPAAQPSSRLKLRVRWRGGSSPGPLGPGRWRPIVMSPSAVWTRHAPPKNRLRPWLPGRSADLPRSSGPGAVDPGPQRGMGGVARSSHPARPILQSGLQLGPRPPLQLDNAGCRPPGPSGRGPRIPREAGPRPLLDAAQRQFEAIGMTGWIRQAEELRKSLA